MFLMEIFGKQLKVEAIIDSEGYAIRKLHAEGFPCRGTCVKTLLGKQSHNLNDC